MKAHMGALALSRISYLAAFATIAFSLSLNAEVTVTVERIENSRATDTFDFKQVSSPKRKDAASTARGTVLSGQPDRFSGGLSRLTDGELPTDQDDPSGNFFFAAGTKGGRLVFDLGSVMPVREVDTYSWHTKERGPQVYVLYGAAGNEANLNLKPDASASLASAGWRQIAKVDTRSDDSSAGGQYAVSIHDSEGNLGDFRYLVFEIAPTEDQDPFGNTFYSEIDVVNASASAVEEPRSSPEKGLAVVLDTDAAPDLQTWTEQQVLPVVTNWYPKLTRLLASAGYNAPAKITLRYRTDMPAGVPAAASGRSVSLNADWFRKNLQGEAVGSVIHELVHVVQNYSWARQHNPSPSRTPGWVVEGIADYVRWFLYEPEALGAEITTRNLSRARYDASYRVTANFLNWVATLYGHNVIWSLNAAAREGRYAESFWREQTGQSLEELGNQWRSVQERRLQREAERREAAVGPQP